MTKALGARSALDLVPSEASLEGRIRRQPPPSPEGGAASGPACRHESCGRDSENLLTGLDSALAVLLDGLAPVAPARVPLDEALGRVAAEMPPLQDALPSRPVAAVDGFALAARELAGASAYSPAPLAHPPAFVEAGEALPEGCDCVLDAGLLDRSGPLAQVLSEAAPGEGVRRAGDDMAAGRPQVIAGRRITPLDLLVLRRAGLTDVAVRSPRVRVIDVGSASGDATTTAFILDAVRQCGSVSSGVETVGRDAASIAAALDGAASDLVLLVGGTGSGPADHVAEALAMQGEPIAHRLALRPGETAAVARLGAAPAVALPGMADQAFAVFLALVRPLLDRLSGREPRQGMVLPLGRKIASLPGLAELVLVSREGERWLPLAAGSLSLDRMRLADAFLIVPSASEGHAAGSPVAAFSLRDES